MSNTIDFKRKEFDHIVDSLLDSITISRENMSENAKMIGRYYASLLSDMPDEPFECFYKLVQIYLDELYHISTNMQINNQDSLEYNLCVITALPHKMLLYWGKQFPGVKSEDNPILLVPVQDDRYELSLADFIGITEKLLQYTEKAMKEKDSQSVMYIIENFLCLSLKEIAETV